MRRIMHIDMDAFFAAVEILRRPELAGKPVVVGGSGDPYKRGVVSTASYEARRFGVHSAMPLITAKRLCPQCVFLPVDYAEYSRISGIIKAIFFSFSPYMEDVGIDEAYLDITEANGAPQEIAADIKSKIREATGLTCSIGIAPNKLLAKIASDLKKPDGITVINAEDVKRVIWPLPARKLPGIGPKTEAVLKAMAINTIGDVASKTLEFLEDNLGKSYGGYLYQASRGIDDSPVITGGWEPKSISREETFEADISDWQAIARSLAFQLKDVAASMRDQGCTGKTVTVKIRFEDFQTVSRAKTLKEATCSLEVLRKAVFECLGRIELKKRVRLVGVRVSSLVRNEAG
ncbi:MAG: DNA polymerase IV [Nitrospiraceae bacterium]|nr:DNA polymerase IV [Nitrospiraceae bacterium]